MTKVLLSLVSLVLLTFTTMAQSEVSDASFCETPFVTESELNPSAQPIVRVDNAIFTDDVFSERMQFEHAYNGIQYQIRLAQLTQQAEALSLPVETLIEQDSFFNQMISETQLVDLLGLRVLADLREEATVWDYASQNNIIITRADFDRVRLAFFDVPDIETAEETGILEDFYAQLQVYGSAFEITDMFFCRLALYDLVRTDIFGDFSTATFVNADHILVSSEEIANDILTLIDNGGDFATIATELSLDTQSALRGGELGWQVAVFYVEPFAEATLTGEVGTILPIVETQFGWHVIRLNGREDRPIEDEQLREAIASTQFSVWRQNALDNYTITVNENWRLAVPELVDNGVDRSE